MVFLLFFVTTFLLFFILFLFSLLLTNFLEHLFHIYARITQGIFQLVTSENRRPRSANTFWSTLKLVLQGNYCFALVFYSHTVLFNETLLVITEDLQNNFPVLN